MPELVLADVLVDHLANLRFPADNFIRSAHELNALQEPDAVHDVSAMYRC